MRSMKAAVLMFVAVLMAACTENTSVPFGVNPPGPTVQTFTGSIQVGTVLGGDHAVLNLTGPTGLDTTARFEWFLSAEDRLAGVNQVGFGQFYASYVVLPAGGTWKRYLRWRPDSTVQWTPASYRYTRSIDGTWVPRGAAFP